MDRALPGLRCPQTSHDGTISGLCRAAAANPTYAISQMASLLLSGSPRATEDFRASPDLARQETPEGELRLEDEETPIFRHDSDDGSRIDAAPLGTARTSRGRSAASTDIARRFDSEPSTDR